MSVRAAPKEGRRFCRSVHSPFTIHYSLLPTRRAPRAAALTLIELIVVMAIMTILASAIIVSLMGGMRHAQIKGTEAFFETLKAQLNQYHDIHRMYMPEAPNSNPSKWTTLGLWQGLEHEGKFAAKKDFVEKVEEDNGENISSTFTDPVTGEKVQRYRYVDAWRNPVQYTCDPPFTRFELRSRGRDLEMDNDDDIIVTD